jgi:predicted TIM-barrel fold metal-dependent hydrolase
MPLTRRHFLLTSTCALAGHAFGETPAEPIIDIHQHTNYLGRPNEDLLIHQRTMGVTQTILLPAGTPMMTPSTHQGKSNGLAAKAMGNENVRAFAGEHPGEFLFGANEVTDSGNARAEIEAGLKLAAKVIGEQKFGVACDSVESQVLYGLAEEYNVPVLLHFQHLTYNLGYERFYTMLDKFPKVNFIGHAQTVWANIDKNHADQATLYPKGPVTPGGITDIMLTKYPNFYADMSAGSGLNAMTRDEEHARGFMERHQEKLLFGSDCPDIEGKGEKCTGTQIIATIRRLAPGKAVERKLLFENAKRLFRLA